MPKAAQSIKSRQALLDHRLTEVGLFIKKHCPKALVEISLARYEDEDAHVLVFPPDTLSDKARERLANTFADKSVSILLETGLMILIGVYEPAQRR